MSVSKCAARAVGAPLWTAAEFSAALFRVALRKEAEFRLLFTASWRNTMTDPAVLLPVLVRAFIAPAVLSLGAGVAFAGGALGVGNAVATVVPRLYVERL